MVNYEEKIKELKENLDYYKCIELLFVYDLESLGIELTEDQYKRKLKGYSSDLIYACDQIIQGIEEY